IDEKGKTEISLQKEVPLEMERTAFIRCYANTIIVGVNEIAMNNSVTEAEIDLFSIDKTTNKVSASKLNLSILTGLYIDENRIFVSGVVWDNSSVKGKSFIYETSSEKLIQITDFNFDNIVKTDNGYLTSNGNQIRKISSEGIIINEAKINGYRIYSLVKHNGIILLTYSAESGNYLLILNEENLKPETAPYFISNKQISNKLTISKNNELYFQDINSTFIYRMK
ncbi:MAG: hypothetical protein Q8Q47_07440, partial [Ignavibacteriaceae bacterium]|nr:hypothetical protein [Ignavibacteriaceae bacterium]